MLKQNPKLHLKCADWLQDINLVVQKFYTFLILLITFTSVILFLLLRDQRLIHRLTNVSESTDALTNSQELICSDLPVCFRFSHRFALTLLDGFYTTIISIVKIPLDKSITGGISLEDRRIFIEHLSLITMRILALVLLFLILKKLLNTSFRLSLLILSITLIVNSGIFYLFATAYLNLGIESYAWIWIRNLSSMYLLDYDWVALSIILLILKLGDDFWMIYIRNKFLSFIAGFILTSFFEYLGIFCAIYILFSLKFKLDSKLLSRLIFLVFGSFVYVASYSIFVYEPTKPTIFNTFSYYFNENLERILRLPLLVTVFLLIPTLIIFCVAKILRRFLDSKNRKLNIYENQNLVSAMASFILIVLVGFFTSGMTIEFGRQTFALQILLSIYIWMGVLSKFNLKQSKKSI